MKAKHCDECKHSVVEEAILTGGQWKTYVLTCTLGHKPRFYKPRYIHDYQWGWKRNCIDYESIEGGGDAKAKPAAMGQEVSFVPVRQW